MQRALAIGTLVALSLSGAVALAQGAPPRPAAPAPADPAPAPAPTTPASSTPPAPAAKPAPAPAAPGSAAPAPGPAPAQPAPVPAPPAPGSPTPTPAAPEPTAPPANPAPQAEPPSPASPTPPVMVGTAPTSTEPVASAKPADRGEESKPAKAPPDPWQEGHALGAEAVLYVSGRLGPSSIEPAEEDRAGLGFDLSAWFTLSREYVLGFGLTHADLGNVSTTADVDSFEGDYGVTAPYIGVRAFPWRTPDAELFLGLRVGLAWQDIDARGWRTLQPNISQPEPFTCSGVSGPGVALGAGVGGAFRLASRAWFTAHVDANGYRMTSDVVENCAVGIGSATNATLGAGLLYAFDLGEDASLSSSARRRQTW